MGIHFKVARPAKAALCLIASAVVFMARSAAATTATLNAGMSGASDVPANASLATGTCAVSLDEGSGNVSFSGTFAGLTAPASAAAIHGLANRGATAPVLLAASTLTAGTTGTFSGAGTLTPSQFSGMLADQTYCEVGDAAFSGGEIRGQLLPPPPTPALSLRQLVALVVVFCGLGIVLGRRQRAASIG